MADEHLMAPIENLYTGAIPLFAYPSVMVRCQHTDWDICESQRLQELKEARDRAAQMEMTMRWWSECTASWREKWSTVRNERNLAREECHALRDALDGSNAQLEQATNARHTAETEVQRLRRTLHRHKMRNLHVAMPDNVIEPIESVDAQVEVIPSRQNKTVQTDVSWSSDPLTTQHQRNIAHFLEREKCLALESKIAALESKLSCARLQTSEAEISKAQAMEQISELKRCNEENMKNAKNRQARETEKLNTELLEAKDENDSLKEENINLHKEIESLRRMLQISLLGVDSTNCDH